MPFFLLPYGFCHKAALRPWGTVMNPIKTTISVLTIVAAMVIAAGVGWSMAQSDTDLSPEDRVAGGHTNSPVA
jgi:hypothetical protein